MICVICRSGETEPGTTTVTSNREESTVILKGVPADVCDQCGEYYLSTAVAKRVMTLVEEAAARGAEVEILRWVA